MKVAVTGAKGFLGASTVNILRSHEHQVVELDLVSGHNILDPKLGNWLEGCDHVIHLAGLLGTSELFDIAEEAVNTNVIGVIKVLQCCQKYNIGYTSIAQPQVWENVYSISRHSGRRMASAWNKAFDVPVSYVRAFNAFGPKQAHGHNHPQKIVPTFSVLAWENKPIPIWGSGEQTVDLIYSEDVARILVESIGYGDDQTIDAGTGKQLTVNEVAKMIIEITGSTAGINYLPMRKGESLETDICAKGEGWDLLDWVPTFKHSDLEKTVRWYQKLEKSVSY